MLTIFNDDTIVAPATPAGGAIGVVRLSGNDAITIADKLFTVHKRNRTLASAKPNTLHYGLLRGLNGEEIDDVIASVFRAPHSFTGEDAVEFSCHGSEYIMRQIIHACIDAGARQATPGEYTRRAYLNGKLDLSQAEAVADLISANNKTAHKIALSQLKGKFSSELTELRAQLLKMTSLLELELDFSDHEELEFADREELNQLAHHIDNHVTSLLKTYKTGNALKQGIPVAIVGKTNVGKSTLLNQLLNEEKAIVTDIEGTTRDVIEDTIDIQGVLFRMIDTAGIRKTQDKIERIGIERTYQKVKEAIVVIWLIDQEPTEEEFLSMAQLAEDKKLILVQNKIDVNSTIDQHHSPTSFLPFAQLAISAKQGLKIDELKDIIYKASGVPELKDSISVITNTRHYEALLRAHDSLVRVIESLEIGLSGDLVAEDLRLCIDHLAEITGGQITSNEVLGNIFKHFCIGK